LLLWAAGVVHSGGFVAFLLGCVASGTLVIRTAVRLAPAGEPLRAVRKGVLLALVVLVPVFFDPDTADIFNVSKYAVVVVAAGVLAALMAVEAVLRRRPPRWRSPLLLPVAALLFWAVVTTATSSNWRLSLLGEYGTYQGLYLLTALTVIFLAVYDAFRLSDAADTLAVAYLGGGGLVVLYGLLQLHDRLFPGSRWDWIHWQSISFESAIWSTFGNPNHLAGYLATILPIGVVLLVLPGSRVRKVLTGLIGAGLLLELLETATRGAWGATVVALVVLGLLLSTEVRQRRRYLLALFGGVAFVCLAGGGVLASSQYVRTKFDSAFAASGDSTIVQRVELWKSAFKMAGDRPLVGLGPDTFQSRFQQYQTAKFVHLYGPDQLANGPHNVFAWYLSGQGYVGLLLWVVLLVVAVWLAAAGWRRLGAMRRLPGQTRTDDIRVARIVLAGTAAALLAYLLQNSFDPQQVGLVLMFWTLLGLLAVIGAGAGFADHRLRSLTHPTALSDTAGLEPPDAGEAPAATASPRLRARSGRGRRTARKESWEPAVVRAVGAGLLLAIVFGFFVPAAASPYRADHDYWVLQHNQQLARDMGDTSSPQAQQLLVASVESLRKAIATNPWEPTYVATAGRARLNDAQAQVSGSQQEFTYLDDARGYLATAARLAPHNGAILIDYGQVYLLTWRGRPTDTAARATALALFRRAVAANPYEVHFKTVLLNAIVEHR
ncbi:MAG TPA: O-antigen ligase family protein, partial [Acidimicrobiales bacterium]|nr:O-antigen ligase family protein [Acidimicrobiales bacterium]